MATVKRAHSVSSDESLAPRRRSVAVEATETLSAAAFRHKRVKVLDPVYEVALSEGDDIPAEVRGTLASRMQSLLTCGDGGCAVHATCGSPSASGELFASGARDIAKRSLTHVLHRIPRNAADAKHLEGVRLSLWSELTLPYMESNFSVESICFWKALQKKNPTLAREAKVTFEAIAESRTQREALQKEVLSSSREFFTEVLEEQCVRRIAVQLGYIPGNTSPLAMSRAKLDECIHANTGCAMFLEPAMSGEGYVKGTRVPFPSRGPVSKYAALFDKRPEFDALRLLFLVGADRFSQGTAFHEALVEIISAVAMSEEGFRRALDLQHKVRVWGLHRAPRTEPEDFTRRAWPAYMEAIEREEYYFSIDELLVICDVRQVNVVLFKQIGSRLEFVGGSFHHAGVLVCAKLAANNVKRVRSHFERLVCVEEIEKLKGAVREEEAAERKEEERAAAEVRRAFEEREREASEKEEREEKDENQQRKGRTVSDGARKCGIMSEEAFERAVLDHEERQTQRMVAEEEERLAYWAAVEEAAQGHVYLEDTSDEPMRGEKTEKENENEPRAENEGKDDGHGRSNGEEDETVEDSKVERQRAEWLSMFHITVKDHLQEKALSDLLLEVVHGVAEKLRNHPTMPHDPASPRDPWEDAASGGRLPPVSCAFKGCSWYGPGTKRECVEDPEHPWDQELRRHVLCEHGGEIKRLALSILSAEQLGKLEWDIYKEAIAVKERCGVPCVGPSVDRRAMEHLVQVYNDEKIRSLICFCCAQIKVDTGRCRSEIGFRNGRWLFGLSLKTIWNKFAFAEYERRYCRPGTALAPRGGASNSNDCVNPDFSDWEVRVAPHAVEEFIRECERAGSRGGENLMDFRKLSGCRLLCCPEDMECKRKCVTRGELCLECKFPLCRSCRIELCNSAG